METTLAIAAAMSKRIMMSATKTQPAVGLQLYPWLTPQIERDVAHLIDIYREFVLQDFKDYMDKLKVE